MLTLADLAALTTALTLIATETIKGVANAAGRDLWPKIKSILGWTKDPPVEQLQRTIEERLQADTALALKLLDLLQKSLPLDDTASVFVKDIKANKSVIGSNIRIGGDLRM